MEGIRHGVERLFALPVDREGKTHALSLLDRIPGQQIKAYDVVPLVLRRKHVAQIRRLRRVDPRFRDGKSLHRGTHPAKVFDDCEALVPHILLFREAVRVHGDIALPLDIGARCAVVHSLIRDQLKPADRLLTI